MNKILQEERLRWLLRGTPNPESGQGAVNAVIIEAIADGGNTIRQLRKNWQRNQVGRAGNYII